MGREVGSVVAPACVGRDVTCALEGLVDGLDVGQLVVGSTVGIDDGHVDGWVVGCCEGWFDG